MLLRNAFEEIIDASIVKRSDVLPSVWAEQNRVMTGGESKFKGKFSYRLTPYSRPIIDWLSPSHPMREGWVMKGAQIGISKGVIENGINYLISEHPGNILYMVGHSDLVDSSMRKLDLAIDGCGNGHLIRATSQRRGGKKSGDTNEMKEFAGGFLKLGSATNHKLIRQDDAKYGFYDDFEAARTDSKESGDTAELIDQRHASYYDDRKVVFLSSPELRGKSNIEDGYLRGDQRRFFIPCPKCMAYITLEWAWDVETNVCLRHGVDVENIIARERAAAALKRKGQPAPAEILEGWNPADGKSRGGIYWRIDDGGRLIEESVGYVCQCCGNWFDDREKPDWMNEGVDMPTAISSNPDVYSMHISSLYAPHGMKGWLDYVRQYLKACPPGLPKQKRKYQTFMNVGLGLTYEDTREAAEAKKLMKNTRSYRVGTVPEWLSKRDGNGHIVLLTLAADLNGKQNDARLDYEVVGWAENGASYSITHGSIGTFVPLEGSQSGPVAPRQKWTYEHGHERSVWPEFLKVITRKFTVHTNPDEVGREMGIFIAGVDVGHHSVQAYDFLDRANAAPTKLVGLRGDKGQEFIKENADRAWYKKGVQRDDYWFLEVNLIKDELAELMALKWSEQWGLEQPAGFMNYPEPRDGLYGWTKFFEHYESEHIEEQANRLKTNTVKRWVKRSSKLQNHMWDCRVYNLGLRELAPHLYARSCKPMLKGFTYRDFAAMIAKVYDG